MRGPARQPTAALFWRLFLVTGVVFVFATAVLVFSPVTVSAPILLWELAVLGVGLTLMLAVNAFLLRTALKPLDGLTVLMQRVDLLRPGQRAQATGSGEVARLVDTFNEMLDRLEAERGASAAATSTLFALASLSKPMTTTMMASLADDGLLDWDQPVHEIISSFALSHPEWAQQVRLRHLVGLSSGVPENNTLLFLERLTPTQMIASLPEIPSVAPPGELYGYSNHAFSTGGYAAAVLAGASYEDASLSETFARTMRERVFDPIGMPSATLDFDAAAADENHATPHRYEPWSGVVESMPLEPERFEMQVAPGGGVRANVADVAKFALSQFDGPARVVSEESLAELHEGVVEMEPGAHYALGWEVWDDYLGMKTLRHTGNSLGFTTSLRIAPNERLGVVVLVNEGFVDPFVAAIDRFVMELLLGRPHADDAENLAALSELRTWQREFVAQTTPADQAGAEPFLGRYSHATSVTFSDAGLQLETNNGPYPLLSTSAPGTLALGGVLSSVLVVERDEAASGASSLTFGRPISDPLAWPATLERLGD